MKKFKLSEPATVEAVELSAGDIGELCVALGFDADALSGTDVEAVMLVVAEDGGKSFQLKTEFEALYNEQVPRGRKPKSASAGAANDDKQVKIPGTATH